MPQRRSWLRRRKMAPGEHSWIQSRMMELEEGKPELGLSKLALVGRTIALEERKIAPGGHSWLQCRKMGLEGHSWLLGRMMAPVVRSWLLRHKLALEVRSWLLGRKLGLEGIRLLGRKSAPGQSNRHHMMEGQIRS